jgi:hypothetical protein
VTTTFSVAGTDTVSAAGNYSSSLTVTAVTALS